MRHDFSALYILHDFSAVSPISSDCKNVMLKPCRSNIYRSEPMMQIAAKIQNEQETAGMMIFKGKPRLLCDCNLDHNHLRNCQRLGKVCQVTVSSIMKLIVNHTPKPTVMFSESRSY